MNKVLKTIIHADIGRIIAGILVCLGKKDRLLLSALLLTAASFFVLQFEVPHVNGPDQWRWQYTPWRSFIVNFVICTLRLVPWALCLGALAFAAARKLRGRLRTVAMLTLLIMWGMVFSYVSFRAISPFAMTHFGRAIQHQGTTGFFHLAVRLDGPIKIDLLSLYPEYMNDMPLHPSTHPPGGTAICKWIIDLYEWSPALVNATRFLMGLFTLNLEEMASDTLSHKMAAFGVGSLMLLAGLLTAWPLFLLVRDGFGGGVTARRAAWAAAIFWVHYPALMIFCPEFDQVYPFLALAIAWLLLRGMNGPGLVYAASYGVIAGVLFTAGFLISFTFGVWAPLLLIMLVFESARRAGSWRTAFSDDTIRRIAWLGIGGIATGVAILAVLQQVYGMDIVSIFSRAYEMNHRFRLRAERTYLIWLFFSPWDVCLVTGPALLLPAIAFGLRAICRGWAHPERILSAWVMGPLGIVLMTLTGLMPGENARLYLMFMPSIAWAGGAWLAIHSRRGFWLKLAALVFAQIVFFYILRTKMKFMDL